MDQNTFTGMFVVAIGSLCGLLVWFGSAVWKLAGTLTKMEVTLEHLLTHSNGHEKELKEHRDNINNHETRITMLEAVVQED